MTIDERIKTIMKKIEKLSQCKDPEFSCGEFPPKWEKPLSEKKVEAFENKKGIKLPEDYRRFITTVASAGTQPFYGLYGLLEGRKVESSEVEKPFICTIEKPLDIYKLTDEEYDAIYDNKNTNLNSGFIFLCTEGCGMYSILVVNTEDKDTYGTVWFYDLANDGGIFPLINPKDKKPMHFLDWLEYWADKTLEISDSEYFTYAELTEYFDE